MNDILILQSDCSLLLDRAMPSSKEVEKKVQRFAEHKKRVGQFEQYYISPLSLWNALSMGISADFIIGTLQKYKRYELPLVAEYHIHIWLERFGKLYLTLGDVLECVLTGDKQLLEKLLLITELKRLVTKANKQALCFGLQHRGTIKQILVREGYNVIDECGFENGESLTLELLKHIKQSNRRFALRDYQRQAIAAFHRDRIGGSGVIVLPCGTGKTLTGIGVIASLQCATLIITSNMISCEQWKQELIQKTTLTEEDIGIYGGNQREVKPITIATYHILSYRQKKHAVFPHMVLFNKRDWGLIIYDEVHLLPAPVFRMTASIQATRRLGLTATLIREDGCAPDVYSLVGAKLFDLHWKEAEQKQVIAKVKCIEVHTCLNTTQQKQYEKMNRRDQYKFASINENKLEAIKLIVKQYSHQQILIIGQYLEQLNNIAVQLNAQIVTGQTPHTERQQLFEQFRNKQINVLVLSKIANLALNLPNASIAIQVSGSYGSRQEEAQRIGRIIRPKENFNEATFFTIVTANTIEEQFSLNRGRFMEEQGYSYELYSMNQLVGERGEYSESGAD